MQNYPRYWFGAVEKVVVMMVRKLLFVRESAAIFSKALLGM